MSVSSQVRVKQSLFGDSSCFVTSTQAHPHFNKPIYQAFSDLYLELDHLRGSLQDLKERELHLQAEVLDCKEALKFWIIKGFRIKKIEYDNLVRKIMHLESENTSLSKATRVGGEAGAYTK